MFSIQQYNFKTSANLLSMVIASNASDSKKHRIIGAGLSGLSAAINFAKKDEKVVIHESREDVGMQFHPNYQVLLKESPNTPSSEAGAKEYLNRWGLNPKFTFKNAKPASNVE